MVVALLFPVVMVVVVTSMAMVAPLILVLDLSVVSVDSLLLLLAFGITVSTVVVWATRLKNVQKTVRGGTCEGV